MTVGGSTIGSATSVSTAGASFHRVVFSHCASGRPTHPSTSVVIAASRSVSHSDCQSGGGNPRKVEAESDKSAAGSNLPPEMRKRFWRNCAGSRNGVAERAEDFLRGVAFQELEVMFRRRVFRAAVGEHGSV